MTYVYATAREIAAATSVFKVVVTKSTVSVGNGDEIEHIFREEFQEKDIAVVSNTKLLGNAPAITIIQALLDGGADVHVFDPEGMEAAKAVLGPVTYGKNPYEIATGAEAIVVVTEWEEFRALDFRRLKQEMKSPVIVDLRNIYKPDEMAKYGFSHFPVGKRKTKT